MSSVALEKRGAEIPAERGGRGEADGPFSFWILDRALRKVEGGP